MKKGEGLCLSAEPFRDPVEGVRRRKPVKQVKAHPIELALVGDGSGRADNPPHLQLSASSLVKGVRAAEQDIADEAFVPFEGVYRGLKGSLNKALAGLPPIFKYGSLDRALSKISKEFSMDDAELVRLPFHMGIIGRVSRQNDEGEKTKYCLADFFFNSAENVVFAGSDELCFHPVFSTYYNADTRRKGDKRIIYPRGVEAEIQERHD